MGRRGVFYFISLCTYDIPADNEEYPAHSRAGFHASDPFLAFVIFVLFVCVGNPSLLQLSPKIRQRFAFTSFVRAKKSRMHLQEEAVQG